MFDLVIFLAKKKLSRLRIQLMSSMMAIMKKKDCRVLSMMSAWLSQKKSKKSTLISLTIVYHRLIEDKPIGKGYLLLKVYKLIYQACLL